MSRKKVEWHGCREWAMRAEKAERENLATQGLYKEAHAMWQKAERERDEARRISDAVALAGAQQSDLLDAAERELDRRINEDVAEIHRLEARIAALTAALREIEDNPLPAEPGYECAWCNGVRKHHKECPWIRAAAALAAEGAKKEGENG